MISKEILLACTLSSMLLLSGCGNKEKKEEAKTATSPATIKVTKNAVKKSTKKEVSKENGGQFYYSYNKEDESKEAKDIDKYNSETNKVRTTIDAYLNIKSPYERVRITMMIKQLSKDYIIKCAACHDDYANGVIGPSLLDKDKDFIYQRILDFKTGKKKNVLMKELVSQISDKKLEDMAQEIANFNKQIRKMRMGK
jgi:cytochrome c553